MNRPDPDDEPPTHRRMAGCIYALAGFVLLIVLALGVGGVFLVLNIGNPGPLPKARPTPPVKAEEGPPPREVGPAKGGEPGQSKE